MTKILHYFIHSLVDCNHHAMTAMLEYSGSLAWKNVQNIERVQIAQVHILCIARGCIP